MYNLKKLDSALSLAFSFMELIVTIHTGEDQY